MARYIATARKLDKVADLEAKYPKAAKALALDVTDAGQVDSVVTQAFAQFGQVDVLVNNAGLLVLLALSKRCQRQSLCRCLRRTSLVC